MEGRRNNYDALRLLAAFSVLFGHSFALTGRPRPEAEALGPFLGFHQTFDGVGVSIFFFISGLLVTASYVRRASVFHFLEARILRIYPAIIVNISITVFVLGAAVTSLGLSDYFADPQTWNFLLTNWRLGSVEYHLPGVFSGLHDGGSVNGSLWTLPHEIRLYGWCAVLGLLGIFRFRWAYLALYGPALVLYAMQWPPFENSTGSFDRLWIMFFAGMGASLFRDVLGLNWTAFVIAGVGLSFAGLPPRIYDVLISLWLGYGVLLLAYWRYAPRLDIGRYGDFSYGLYIYAFPVQQTVLLALGVGTNPYLLMTIATPISFMFAVLSWFWVERPALSFKGRGVEAARNLLWRLRPKR